MISEHEIGCMRMVYFNDIKQLFGNVPINLYKSCIISDPFHIGCKVGSKVQGPLRLFFQCEATSTRNASL